MESGRYRPRDDLHGTEAFQELLIELYQDPGYAASHTRMVDLISVVSVRRKLRQQDPRYAKFFRRFRPMRVFSLH